MTATRGARLTYSLSGPDAGTFSIDANTGQLSVAPGATLDPTKSSYMFSVTATDLVGLTATRAVTITVVTALQRDWEALKALYNAANGVNWSNKTGWRTGVEADQAPTATELNGWHGVNVVNGRVAWLRLQNNNLWGPLPPELSKLDNLEILNLTDNRLSGNIPDALGDLTRLRRLQLSDNRLEGPIPTALGKLTNLQLLWLHINLLTGTIPAELGELTNLEEMYLNNNKLTGTVPENLGKLANLTVLVLNTNKLTDAIPDKLTEINTLTRLEIQGQTVESGQIELCVPQANVFTLWLAGIRSRTTNASHVNALLCERTLREDWEILTALYNATDGTNWTNKTGWEAGVLLTQAPTELTDWHGVSVTNGRVTGLALASNNLTGAVPAVLGNLTELQILQINGNKLTGALPEDLTRLTALTVLHTLGQTVESGELALCVPREIVFTTWLDGIADEKTRTCPRSLRDDFEALKALYNATNGANWTNNTKWVAGVATDQAPTPTELGTWHGVTVTGGRVTGLALASNNLVGNIPAALGTLDALETLQLNGNQLTSPIPASLASIDTLTTFQINSQTVDAGQVALCVPQGDDFDTWLAGITSLAGNSDHAPRCVGSLADDWLALRAFYNAVNGATLGDSWTNIFTASDSPTPSALGALIGVTVTNGRVTQINLPNRNLTGTLPPELGNLTELTT